MAEPTSDPIVVLFRDDLRLCDNPALHAAAATGRPVLCLFILDQESPGVRPLGGASRWWLHHSLKALGERIAAIGGRLDLFAGRADQILAGVPADACTFNRRYGGGERAVDGRIEALFAERGGEAQSFNGTLWHEPGDVRSKTGGAFKVYTPFLRASMALGPPGKPLPAPRRLKAGPSLAQLPGYVTLEQLELLPAQHDWSGGLREAWTPGEVVGRKRLLAFLDLGLGQYGEDRNRPALAATSGLSPHLRHGEVSPREAIAEAIHAAEAGKADRGEVDKFVSEVIWRDFDYNLLVEHPDLATAPVHPGFLEFPFQKPTAQDLKAWQRGRTGYPIVDAGMRQLWQTGVMHNRVRMITASFLIKHMLTDWRVGEAWFWDTLVDADPANNAGNWQWVAGCGADASPFFRIFNPTAQGEKFDPDGAYVRSFVPEIGGLAPKWIHRPWEAPPEVLDEAGIALGETYPRPLVEHEVARKRALEALATMRSHAR